MVTAALPYLAGDALEVLIGGLGLGYALDEALACPRVAHVTVAEYEPPHRALVRGMGEGRAERAAAGERVGPRASSSRLTWRTCCGRRRGASTSSLSTPTTGRNGSCARPTPGLYSEAGVGLAREALRPGGAAVFWSPERYPAFESCWLRVFGGVLPVPPTTWSTDVATSTRCMLRRRRRTPEWARKGRLRSETKEAGWGSPGNSPRHSLGAHGRPPRRRPARPELRRPARMIVDAAGVRRRPRGGQRDAARSRRPGVE